MNFRHCNRRELALCSALLIMCCSPAAASAAESPGSATVHAGAIFLAVALGIAAVLVYFLGVRRARAGAALLTAVLLGGAVVAAVAPHMSFRRAPEDPETAETDHRIAAEDRTGAWVDEIIAVREARGPSYALERLLSGDTHIYAFGITDEGHYERIRREEELGYERHLGTSSELAFNPAGPVFGGSGELNPFAVPRVREAMNLLVDRQYIAEEIYGGMARPRWLPINSAFADYARMVDVARMLERRYAHDPARAESIIREEMEKLGAELRGEDGASRWHYGGKPVELGLLIRTEDERREIGDYVATLLEGIGFAVNRQYRDASQASPIWSGADPEEGLFHIYTGAWISTIVRRDDTSTFDFYYTSRGLPSPLWQAFEPSEEFDHVAERLSSRDFSSMEERSELFARALELSLEDSVRIWLVDQVSVSPRRREISVAADLGGGISGAYLWPYTLRLGDQVGGSVRIAVPDLLPDPWNPLDGSNWIFDMMFTRATSDYGTMLDPYTGLALPQRIERGEVVIEEGLPVQKTHDWATLEFRETIEVPEDAWIDWDAGEQRFITVGEKHPDGLTARRKSVAYYPGELYDTSWHDGSPFSIADIILGMILTFDRASEESKLFDEAQVDSFESFQRHFRGVRIRSIAPLVIESYSNSYSLDAENNISGWYPNYTHGPGAWHTLAVGKLAEKAEKLAFSKHKADMLEVEWMSMVAGPSIGILAGKLEKAAADNYIPYAPVLGEYVDSEEVARRWRNLKDWYGSKGHFWVGTGPFYLQSVSTTHNNLHLRRFDAHPDPAAKWQRFEEPMMPEVDVAGPRAVSPGSEAEFEIDVSYGARPYPAEFIENVAFLWYGADDDLVLKGEAAAVEDGRWKIVLPAQDAEDLEFGPNRIEVAVVSKLVSIPIFETRGFVVRP